MKSVARNGTDVRFRNTYWKSNAIMNDMDI